MSDHDQEASRQQSENTLLDNLSLDILRAELRDAVADGIKGAMTQEAARAFWGVGIEMLQEQATRRAGRFVLDGALFAIKRVLWAAVALVAIYMLGGWQFVTLAWKAILAKATP